MRVKYLVAVLAVFCLTSALWADDVPAPNPPPRVHPVAHSELTFAANLFNPNNGDTTWAAKGEYLIGLGRTGVLKVGPSLVAFDTGPEDGAAFGFAGELGFQKSGFFLGAAAHKWSGNATNIASYDGELRAGAKFGDGKAFAKFYASQVWAREADGNITDPDGTSVFAGIGWRL